MTKCLSANAIFRERFPKGDKNFMTPNIEKKGKLNCNVAFELSSGRALFDDGTLYGVTIVSHNPKKRTARSLHDDSKSFHSKNDAESYINKLRRKFKR